MDGNQPPVSMFSLQPDTKRSIPRTDPRRNQATHRLHQISTALGLESPQGLQQSRQASPWGRSSAPQPDEDEWLLPERRALQMQVEETRRLMVQGASSSGTAKRKVRSSEVCSDEDGDDDDDDESDIHEEKMVQQRQTSKKRKVEKWPSTVTKLKEMLEEFVKQQQVLDMQWREMMEAREKERKCKEMEWRQSMENLLKERIMAERSCREREEQRLMREEARLEKRDALLTTLLTKLLQEDNT